MLGRSFRIIGNVTSTRNGTKQITDTQLLIKKKKNNNKYKKEKKKTPWMVRQSGAK